MQKTLIIAEAGVNHNGNIELAKKLIDIASEAGADIVKFQTFITENEISQFAPKADYQVKNTKNNESQFDMVKKLEFNELQHLELINHCKLNNIEFMSSPFDIESIKMLDRIGVKKIKIPSGEINNIPYLEKIGSLNKEVVLSTGMSTLDEIREAISILVKNGTNYNNIALLHCNTEYPTPFKDVNLRALKTIKDTFHLPVGYSDHTNGIEVAIGAVCFGAVIIEKHFTINKNLTGPDHSSSLDPYELKAMILSIRNIELAIGNKEKKPSPSELKNINIVRKSIVANKDICKGTIFTQDNITTKRAPIGGISASNWYSVIGKIANKDFYYDELIEL